MTQIPAGEQLTSWRRATYQLRDRSLDRNIGRFVTLPDALAFIRHCVPASRVWHLSLGREDEQGNYLLVSDGPDLRDLLFR